MNPIVSFEVKNYREARWNSEETACFQASLYIRREGDRKATRVATVSNEGHGGPTTYHDPEGRYLRED